MDHGDGAAVEVDFARIGAFQARHDLHEGGLARAVFSGERVDFASLDGEVDGFECPNSPEGFGYGR